MENKSTKTQVIIVSIAIVISLILSLFVALASPTAPIAFGKDYPFEEDYNRYKGYADIYVQTFDKESIKTDEFFNIKSIIKEDFIEITVDGTVSKVVAKYPTKEVDKNSENSTIVIMIKDATYENYSNVESPFDYLFMLLGIVILSSSFFYMVIDLIYDLVIGIKKKKKNKNNVS